MTPDQDSTEIQDRSRAVVQRALAVHASELRSDRRFVLSWRIGLLVSIIVVWQALSGVLLDPFFFSSPARIIEAIGQLFENGRLLENVGYTVYEAFVGYLLGASAAILAAAVFGPSPRLYAIIEPLLLSVYSIPSVAMAPLLIVWFGIGVTSKILLAAYFVFFVVFMNAVTGVRSVHQGWIDCARLMGATRGQVLSKIVLRGAASHLVVGLKIAVPEAVIGAVIGEFISAQKGIGYLILNASSRYYTAGVFAAVLLLGLLVLVMAAGLHINAGASARRA
jgi:NitT/TauT family transport system permease protein